MLSPLPELRATGACLTADICVLSAEVAFSAQRLRVPLHLSRGAITEITLSDITVEVAAPSGRRATGRGMIYLSDLWSWPSQLMEHDARDAAMRALTGTLCANIAGILDGWGHPVELGCVLHEALPALAAQLALPEPMPLLAAGVCASPLDAALHDAYGRLHGQSSYDLLGPAWLPGDLARFIGPSGEGVTLTTALDFRWAPRVPGCVLVSAADPLTPAEVTKPVGDGLPECAEEWVKRHGFYGLKLKVKGKDPREDAAWIAIAVGLLERWHSEMGAGAQPWVSVDPNEAYATVEELLDFLHALQLDHPAAFAALRYVEQPIPRAIGLRADLTPAAALKPILADESITGLGDLDMLARAGWSGLALKTCKSHTLCLLMAAWCHLAGRPYSLQDLTNPALAALHAVGLAARLRTLNGVELNAPQYTPAANADCLAAHPGIFDPRDGVHDASTLVGPGLGYGAP